MPENYVLKDYVLKRVLYQGVFSFTYLASSMKDGSLVVIKENIPGAGAKRAAGTWRFEFPSDSVIAGVGGKQWAEQNFLSEAKVLQQLQHPGVVRVLEVFYWPETCTNYYVMPCLAGGTLAEVLPAAAGRKREWVLYVAAALMKAVEYVQTHGYIHRDIRPENIIFTEQGVPVLIDFGASGESVVSRHTRLVAKGYSPPEQLHGGREGTWTDVYALGATLYFMITGKPVPCARLRAAGTAVYEPLAQQKDLVNQYGQSFLESVDKALTLEASGRFATVRQWRVLLSTVPGFQSDVPVVLPATAALAAALLKNRSVIPGAGRKETVTQLIDNRKENADTEIAGNGGGIGGALGAFSPVVSVIAGNEDIVRRKKIRLLALLLLLAGGLLTALILPTFSGDKEGPGGPGPGPGPGPVIPPLPTEPDYLRIIGRVGATLYDLNGNAVQKKLPPFRVFYTEKEEVRRIAGEERSVYVVKTHPRKDAIGMLLCEEVHRWPLNLAMRFTDTDKRNRSLFFEGEEEARAFMAKSLEQRRALRAKLAETKNIVPGEFRNLLKKYGVVGLEPRERGGEYMPVLDFARKPDGTPAAYAYFGDSQVKARLLNVATMVSKVEIKEVKKVIAPPVNVVFVVDTTSSMSEYLEIMKNVISGQVEDISSKCREKKQQVLFGFVGYRDWKSQGTDGSAETPTGESNTDAGFEKQIGYVVRNYTRDRLLPVEEFLELLNKRDAEGTPLISCNDVDSIDFREEVFGAVCSAIQDTPWSGKKAAWNGDEAEQAYRFIYLIGDAGGREPNEREADCLRLQTSKHWKYRPAGSIARKGVSELVQQMKEERISLRSVFVLTMPLKNSTVSSLSPELWLQHSQLPGIRQFAQLAQSGNSTNCDVFDTRAISSEHRRMQETETYRRMLQDGVQAVGARLNDKTRRFEDLFSMDLKEIVDYSLNENKFSANMEEIEEGESAIGRMFANSHVEWVGSQTETSETLGDATGWTQDRDEGHRTAALRPYIVLTVQQLEMLCQRLKNLQTLVQNDKSSALSSDRNDASSSNNAFTAAAVSVMNDAQRDANRLEGSESQNDKELKDQIAQLPYRSPMLQAYCANEVNQDKLMSKLADTIDFLTKLLTNRADNSRWLRDPKGNGKDDFVLVPIDDLL